MKFRCFSILLSIIFLSYPAKAQNGCLLPNNIVYTSGTLINILGFQTFSRGGVKVPLAPNYCSWTPLTGTTCYVCATITGLVCTDMETKGIRSTNFQMVECNLDDHSWVFGAAAGVFGLFVIRRRNKF